MSVAHFEHLGIDVLADEYEQAHPGISIDAHPDDFTSHHQALQEAIVAGKDAATVYQVDEAYMPYFVAQSDGFVNLLDHGAGTREADYAAWTWAQNTTASGNRTIGLPLDVGGMALCYRADLLDKAGLPSAPADVDTAIGGTWDGLLALGRRYQDAAPDGSYWFDDASTIARARQPQLGLGHAWHDIDGALDLDASAPAIDLAFSTADAGLSAGLTEYTDDWNTALTTGGFATTLCPLWQLDYIDAFANQSDDAPRWQIAPLPGRAGNDGGTSFVIPDQHDADTTQAAYDFIGWLTAPEQQTRIAATSGMLPATPALYQEPSVTSLRHTLTGEQPIGTIFADAAAALQPHRRIIADDQIDSDTAAMIAEVERGELDPHHAWTALRAATG